MGKLREVVTFYSVVNRFRNYNRQYGIKYGGIYPKDVPVLTAVLVINQSSFANPQSLLQRSYRVNNNCGEMFFNDMSGCSVFGNRLDGLKEYCRLDDVLSSIDYCYFEEQTNMENKQAKTSAKIVAEWALLELRVRMPYVLDFVSNDNIYLFGIDDGTPSRIAPNSELMAKIKEIEASRKLKIYAVTHDHVPVIGETYSFLGISLYEEDWDSMVMWVKNNSFMVYAYVHNVAIPEYSESGFVILRSNGRNLLRVG